MTDQEQPSCLLFYCRQMEEMARRIAQIDQSIKLGDVSWGLFPDGYPEIFIGKQRKIRRMDVAFLASLEDPAHIFEQIAAAMTLAGYGVRRLRFVLPFFPPGFMDRADDEGQVVTAKILAQMISLLPVSSRPEVVMYDIHALQLRSYFADHVGVRLKSALKYFFPILAGLGDVAVCFPDYGSRKRFTKKFAKYPQVVCEKLRGQGEEREEREVRIIEGDPRGKHVVIIDDAIMTGGTTIKCRKALLDAGAAKISAFATHGRFPKDSWKKFVGAGFEKIWVTDSCPVQAVAVANIAPFEIISLAASIARVVTDNDDLPSE
jgi:ribose-phosphate pyrophosphokinase